MAYQQIRASSRTIEARLGHSWPEIAQLADRHTLAVQAWLSTRAPQTKIIEGVGVTAISSGLGVRNETFGCDYPLETSNKTIDDDIEAVKAFFAGRDESWAWWLGPTAQPANMGDRLSQHGLSPHSYPLPALVAPLPAPAISTRPEIKIRMARNRADLETASHIHQIGAGNAPNYFTYKADEWLIGHPAKLFLAQLEDHPPVAIGALIVDNGLAGVYLMATLPEWRRQGLARAILGHILNEAADDGHKLVALTAGPEAYPLYRQFGFEHIFEYARYSP